MFSPVRKDSEPQPKTLVFCPIGLGNFLMAMPALAFLSRELGPQNLGILALKGGIRDLARGSGLFGEIFSWDPDKEGRMAGLRILGRIRGSGYRHSLSLFPTSHWKFGAFALLSGIRERAGFGYPHQGWPERLQSLSLSLDKDAHDVDQNLRLVEAFLGKPRTEPPRLAFPLPTTYYVAPEGRSYYVCHPGSSAERGMEEKRLPPEVFADLIVRIRREFGLMALLIGGPEESALRRKIISRAPVAAFEAPAGSLEIVAGQIQGARFFLGNDSGLMHIAAALGRRCAAFFGPTDERRTGPYGWSDPHGASTRHLVLRKEGLECAPCWTVETIGKNPPCIHRDTRCLRSFSADDAWPRLRPFLADILSGPREGATSRSDEAAPAAAKDGAAARGG
jgi:ADP-heptose:LPS heptosyltransferase